VTAMVGGTVSGSLVGTTDPDVAVAVAVAEASGPLVVALDGPSGSGKSSVSRQVASRLGLAYLDTGAMYRAATWWCVRNEVDLADQSAVAALVAAMPLDIGVDPAVNASFSGDSAWLSIAGTAAIVHDDARLEALWSPFVEAWFPEGPRDSKATLLKLSASSAQYWDSPGRLATLVSLVTSKVTGEPKGGESGTVQLD